MSELECALMPRLGRGNPYVPKTGLGGYLGYYPNLKGPTPDNGPKRSERADQDRLTATWRPARAITPAAPSATAAVTSHATV